jgi:hypothetical protein
MRVRHGFAPKAHNVRRIELLCLPESGGSSGVMKVVQQQDAVNEFGVTGWRRRGREIDLAEARRGRFLGRAMILVRGNLLAARDSDAGQE